MEDVLNTGAYVVARENFKEAAEHVSPEKDPVMFNLLFGLQSLADQIGADFANLESMVRGMSAPKKESKRKGPRASRPAARTRSGAARKGGKARKK